MTVFSSSTCPKCKVLKMKLDKAGIEYTVNENVEEAAALGIKSLPYIQLSNGKLLDFAAAIAFVRDMEAANQ
jgi:glutaredoxin